MAGMFLAMAMPAQAATAPVGDLAALLHSDGTIEVVPVEQLNLDAFQTCQGDAPLSNSCTLTDSSTGGWTVGWVLPTAMAGLPAGPTSVAMSTEVKMTSSRGGFVDFGCNWGPGVTGFPFAVVRCALLAFSGDTSGNLVANFHSGAISPAFLQASLPNTNSVEAGVGHWNAILYVYF